MSDNMTREVYGHSRPHPSSQDMAMRAGTSFKPEYLADILGEGLDQGFFEVHAENYMGAGGPPHRALEMIRNDYPLSIHGVTMSIGGQTPLNKSHLRRFRDVVRRYEPSLVSEHLAWSTHEGYYLNDLLPLPYTDATLNSVCSHISQVQDYLQRIILIENPATYITFASSSMQETDFIREMVKRTGCGLLLDLNNVFVSATNHDFSATEYLRGFPLQYVGEIHLAGYNRQQDESGAPLLIDSHDCPVDDSVWDLYSKVLNQTGPVPTLVEWDSQLPPWEELKAQASMAQYRLQECAVNDSRGLANNPFIDL
jgi:uncharacterized protein